MAEMRATVWTVAVLGMFAGWARADVTFIANGQYQGHPLNATADLSAGNGTISILIKNTQSGITTFSQEVSQLWFQINNPSVSLSLTHISGATLDFSNGLPGVSGSVDAAVSNNQSAFHWALGNAGNVWSLQTVGGPIIQAASGQPTYLILGPNPNPGSGMTGPNSPHEPHFDQSALFTFSVNGMTVTPQTDLSGLFSNVYFGFGTGPDALLLDDVRTAPAPGSLALLVIGTSSLAGYVFRRRHGLQIA
jgi:hypothetical protein